jgi:hypothetical protein
MKYIQKDFITTNWISSTDGNIVTVTGVVTYDIVITPIQEINTLYYGIMIFICFFIGILIARIKFDK